MKKGGEYMFFLKYKKMYEEIKKENEDLLSTIRDKNDSIALLEKLNTEKLNAISILRTQIIELEQKEVNIPKTEIKIAPCDIKEVVTRVDIPHELLPYTTEDDIMKLLSKNITDRLINEIEVNDSFDMMLMTHYFCARLKVVK